MNGRLDENTRPRRGPRNRHRRRSLLVSNGKKKRDSKKTFYAFGKQYTRSKYGHHRVYCGCKVGELEKDGKAPWRRALGNKRFQSEPAMAFQILTNGAACLPPDLAHREAIAALPHRSNFTYGVSNSSSGTSIDELLLFDDGGDDEGGGEDSALLAAGALVGA